MKDSDKAFAILKSVEQDCAIARDDYIKQACALAGRRASVAEKTKFELEDGVGGFCSGVTEDENGIKRMEEETLKIKQKWDRWEELRVFAQDTFLHMIPEHITRKHLTYS